MPISFIVYAKQDYFIAKKIADGLSSEGVDIWFDQKEIAAGDSLIDRIKQGICYADYLIILISKYSKKYTFVEKELLFLFEKFNSKELSSIITVVIDDIHVPEKLNINIHIDSEKLLNNAVKEIAKIVKNDCEFDFKKIINIDNLSRDISSDRKTPKGIEYYIPLCLNLIAIIISTITLIPSFDSLYFKIPKVYYDLKDNAISYPPEMDEQQVLNALKSFGIAPAFIRIRIINIGQAPAKDIKIGSKTNGNFLYIKSEPTLESKPVWVDMSIRKFNPGDKEFVILLTNLAPEKNVVFDIGYAPPRSKNDIDIVASGLFAKKVQDISRIPRWSLFNSLKLPVGIFVFGVFISILTRLCLLAISNPRMRRKIFEFIEIIEILPLLKLFFPLRIKDIIEIITKIEIFFNKDEDHKTW